MSKNITNTTEVDIIQDELLDVQNTDISQVEPVVELSDEERINAYLNQPVEIRLFKDNKTYYDDVFVCINGKSFVIQRGITVKVPRYVADVIQQSQEQDASTDRLTEQLVREAYGI